MAETSDKKLIDSARAAIANANDKIAEAKSQEEASGWQGIVNQQTATLKALGLDNA